MASKVSALILTEVLPRLQITSADTRLTYANLLSYTQKVYEDIYYSIVNSVPSLYGEIGYIYGYANNTSASLSANITDYDKSMDFIKFEFKSDSNANYYTGKETVIGEINNPNAYYINTAPIYALYGDTVYIKPVPTANLASAGKAYFTRAASALSGGSVHNLPENFEDALINGVCHYGFLQLGQDNKAMTFLQEYNTVKQVKLREIASRSRTRKRMKDIRENYFGTYYDGVI